MAKHSAVKSVTPSSEHTSDEDDLKTLKLQDRDLDQFAAYFELAFQGNRQSITVLVALLQRLREVETLHRKKQSAIWVEDVVGRLIHRLYTRCDPGFEAASRFATESSELADQIFAEALPVANEL